MTKLQKFHGRKVVKTTVAVTNAGDGLSTALDVEPEEYEHGQVVYVVLETTCTKIHHVPATADNPGGDLVRQHTLKAGRATVVDAGLVMELLDDQQKRIEAKKGIQQLDLNGEEPKEDPAVSSTPDGCTCVFDEYGARLAHLAACDIHDWEEPEREPA